MAQWMINRSLNGNESHRIKFGVFSATLTPHINYPGEWVLRCEPWGDRVVGKIGQDVDVLKHACVMMLVTDLTIALRGLA